MHQESSPSLDAGRRFALAASIFLSVSAMGYIQPYVPLYQAACGLTKGQIGLVAGIGSATMLLLQPILGLLSDRVDARRPLMVVSSIVAGLAYFGFSRAHSFLAFLLLTIAGLNAVGYLNVAAGVIVGRIVDTPSMAGRAYAGYRVWGSIGYIIVALGTGLLLGHAGHTRLDRASLVSIFVYGPLTYLLVALTSMWVPDPKRTELPLSANPSPLQGKGNPARLFPALGRNASPADPNDRNLRIFLIALFLYTFAMGGVLSYLSLFMQRLGESPMWISSTFAVGVVSEVLVMVQIGRLSDRFGRRPALAVAFLALPVRLLLYIPATGALWIMAVHAMHGLNFGIMGAISVVFVNDLATDANRGTAQARLAAAQGLAAAFAPMAGGFLADRIGMGPMFASMAVVAAGAAVLFLTQVHESHPSPESFAERCHPVLRPFARLLAAPR